MIYSPSQLKSMATALRALSMDAVQKANSGHPGLPLGMADVATILFSKFLKFSPQNPQWAHRDRFVLSAGHGSILLYSLLHLCGYEDMTLDELKSFRQLHSKAAGHPEYGHAGGIETTTGPLGQGFANAVGMALAEDLNRKKYGTLPHKTYVLASDGDLMEGISHEAASFAGHNCLKNLIVLFDDNHVSIDGSTDLAVSDDQVARFRAYGWDAYRADGHDFVAIEQALAHAQNAPKPTLIAFRTTIGFGSPNKAGLAACHGAPLGVEEVAATKAGLGWPYGPFDIPEDIYDLWHECGVKETHLPDQEAFQLPADWPQKKQEILKALGSQEKPMATRKCSQIVLNELITILPNLLGGSADLTPSNNTQAEGTEAYTPENAGTYIHYGVREHAMAGMMNGISLHGGWRPYGGTFLIFTDYCRPAIRLAAIMEQPVIYVMTHDSIGLGEDGTTHQPIEHLTSLRAMPNLQVFRPADLIETAQCWFKALESPKAPSVLVLTRQDLPPVRTPQDGHDAAQGAYCLVQPDNRDITFLATGSEVSIALEAATVLKSQGIQAAVVSMPCWELFEDQSPSYRQAVLGAAPSIAIEAAGSFGWERYVGHRDHCISIDTFGLSAPGSDLYKHFGLTVEKLCDKAKTIVKRSSHAH